MDNFNQNIIFGITA